MLREKLEAFLFEHFPDAKLTSSGEEVNIRCRFCGDSRKGSHHHLYIGLGTEDKPPMYHCFICNRSGVLTGDILSQLLEYNVVDPELISELNKEIRSKNKYFLFKKPNKSINSLFYNYYIKDNALNRSKLQYISNRIGYNFTYEEISNNKIILDLHELLYQNEITKYTRSDYTMDILTNHFIGFLSIDNGFLTMRKFTNDVLFPDNLNNRYINYNIFGSKDNHMRYYCIPTQCNLFSNEPIHIRIAEGCFDILSILYNLNNNNRINNIYIASNGKGYFNVIRVLLENFNLATNIIIHLYPDNDIRQGELQYFIDRIKNIYIPMYIHRNTFIGEKDFGVPKNRIQESITKV